MRLPHEADIGLTVRIDQDSLFYVSDVVEGGAAYRAGIRRSMCMMVERPLNGYLTTI